jgi:hypothetical protein
MAGIQHAARKDAAGARQQWHQADCELTRSLRSGVATGSAGAACGAGPTGPASGSGTSGAVGGAFAGRQASSAAATLEPLAVCIESLGGVPGERAWRRASSLGAGTLQAAVM